MFKHNLSHLSSISRIHLINKYLFEIVALSIQPILATPSRLCAHAHAEAHLLRSRRKRIANRESGELSAYPFRDHPKQGAASGLCVMPSRNIPILREMRQARRFRFLRRSSASSKRVANIIEQDQTEVLEAAELGRVKRKMIVCRTRVPFRLPDGTWVVNTSDARKRVTSA